MGENMGWGKCMKGIVYARQNIGEYAGILYIVSMYTYVLQD